MPELVSTLCTFLVLAPLALMPGLGQFLFKPMALAVAFAMIAAYILSRTLVPGLQRPTGSSRTATATAGPRRRPRRTRGHGRRRRTRARRRSRSMATATSRPAAACSARLRAGLRPLGADDRAGHRILRQRPRRRAPAPRPDRRRRLRRCWRRRSSLMWPIMRREFFPEVDAGAFEMYVRAPSGTRIEVTEKRIKEVEDFVRKTIDEDDLQLIVSELGVTADWSAAYTPNAGPMDAVLKVQLTASAQHSAQEYVHMLRTGFDAGPAVQRPGVRLRRRRHGPRGHERGQVDADQHPRHRQEPEDGPRDRHGDQERGHEDRRRGRRRGSSSGSIIPQYVINVDRPRRPTWA